MNLSDRLAQAEFKRQATFNNDAIIEIQQILEPLAADANLLAIMRQLVQQLRNDEITPTMAIAIASKARQQA